MPLTPAMPEIGGDLDAGVLQGLANTRTWCAGLRVSGPWSLSDRATLWPVPAARIFGRCRRHKSLAGAGGTKLAHSASAKRRAMNASAETSSAEASLWLRVIWLRKSHWWTPVCAAARASGGPGRLGQPSLRAKWIWQRRRRLRSSNFWLVCVSEHGQAPARGRRAAPRRDGTLARRRR